MNYAKIPIAPAVVAAGITLSPLTLPLTVAAGIAVAVALVLVLIGIRRRRRDARAAGLHHDDGS